MTANVRSVELRSIAQQVADTLPTTVEEVVVTGSVSRGVADAISDIEPNTATAGAGRITFAVAGLEALLERLAAAGIEHDPIETYSNGVRHVDVPDLDGNRIAFAEPPDAASA